MHVAVTNAAPSKHTHTRIHGAINVHTPVVHAFSSPAVYVFDVFSAFAVEYAAVAAVAAVAAAAAVVVVFTY